MADTQVLHGYVESLRKADPSWVVDVKDALGEVTVTVPRESVVDVCIHLKENESFDMLADLCGSDRGPEEDPRFEVNYHLFSTIHHNRIRIKTLLSEDDAKVKTVTTIWKTANWHERETYDLVGVVFEGHPDLRGYCSRPTSMVTLSERIIR